MSFVQESTIHSDFRKLQSIKEVFEEHDFNKEQVRSWIAAAEISLKEALRDLDRVKYFLSQIE